MQRRALVVLFAVLAAGLGAIAAGALSGGASAGRLLVGCAAAAVALWLASLSLSAFRHRR